MSGNLDASLITLLGSSKISLS